MSVPASPHIFLKGNKYNIPFFLTVLNLVYSGLNTHASLFPGLPVVLATFLAQIQSLEVCQKNVKAKVAGAAGARNEARDVVFATVETIRIFVQGLCAQSPEQAQSLAAAAGMKLATRAPRQKLPLAATLCTQPGLVLLVANAGLLSKSKRTKFYEWEYTLDGKTWLAGPTTGKAKTSIAGLPPLTRTSTPAAGRARAAAPPPTARGGWRPGA